MGTDYVNFSRQDENVNIEKFDRHESDFYNLSENGVKFYLLAYNKKLKERADGEYALGNLHPEIGSYWLEHRIPCTGGNSPCSEGAQGYHKIKIPFKNCTKAISDEIAEFYKRRYKIIDYSDMA